MKINSPRKEHTSRRRGFESRKLIYPKVNEMQRPNCGNKDHRSVKSFDWPSCERTMEFLSEKGFSLLA